jgi:hypothetical membrane protein
MAAPFIFGITVLVVGYMTPGYNPVTQVMSELGIPGEPYAAVMNVMAFGLVGILLMGFAYAVYRAFRARWQVAAGSAMVAGAGLSFFAMAFFHCDQGCMGATPAGSLHLLFGLVAVVAALVAALTLSAVMRQEPGWGGTWQYSLVTAILVIAILPVFLSLQDLAGLLQRIMVGIIFLWTEVLAIRIFLISREE